MGIQTKSKLMKKSFEISEKFPVTAKQLYTAWLDSEVHSEMTGGEAVCSSAKEGKFTAWDGYISGSNIELKPHEKIIQNWRTTEFLESDEDSRIELSFRNEGTGCVLTLSHTNIPEGEADYETGWVQHYFEPMQMYFESL